MSSPPSAEEERLRERVRRHYAQAATSTGPQQGEGGLCCDAGPAVFGPDLYPQADRRGLPQAAVDSSLGCGTPTAVADLHPGEVVLDLGSGAGVDLLLSARRVGATGRVYGLDMTEEMLAAARRNLQEAGATNIVLLKGLLEAIPLPAATVDVVISNCVVALSTDKAQVFAETHRVLRPGGRVGLADVVADDETTPADRAAQGSHQACIAGALPAGDYHDLLVEAGFEQVSVTVTHDIAPGIHAAIVQARKPPQDPPRNSTVDHT